MRLRLAVVADADELANLHWVKSREQPGGFMHRLGLSWFRAYYRIILGHRGTVGLCAEEDRIIGFVVGTLDASETFKVLRGPRQQMRLLVAALPAVLRDFRLISEVRARQRSTRSPGRDEYVLVTGAREEFWAWDARNRSGALELHLAWLSVMRALGVTSVRGEVDDVNKSVLKTHQMFGAKILRSFLTPDGRKRFLIEYDLK